MLDNKLMPALTFRYVAAQTKVSQANMELTSESFTLLDFSARYLFNEVVTITGGVKNIFDTQYTEHLNRRVLGTDYRIAEPGRVFFINLYFNI